MEGRWAKEARSNFSMYKQAAKVSMETASIHLHHNNMAKNGTETILQGVLTAQLLLLGTAARKEGENSCNGVVRLE